MTIERVGDTGPAEDNGATRSFQSDESPTPVDLIGDLLAAFGERYVANQALGQGGFGSVFQAFDTRLNRRVAIKASVMASADPDQLLREARALAQLDHPGIVTVFDVAVSGRHCFIVSELLPGPNLSDWLLTKPTHSEAVRIAAEVADALAHAHSRTVIHRDVKPSNIVFGEDRRPVLVDFGLALTEMDSESERGKISGTPAYMAPEQALGRAHRPDGRTDIYGLGATLYAILCGRPPFRGANTMQVLEQVREDDPQPPRQICPELPAELERICLKALAKRPADRFGTAVDFAHALRQALGAAPKPPVALAPALPPAPKPSPSVARSERRQITLLNCVCEEHVGEDDDPLEHLASFLAICREETLAHGGLPLQTSGSSFLGCFGYPTAREDTPRQAIRTGLAIRQLVQNIVVHSAVGTGIAHITQAANAPPVVVGDVMSMVGALSAQGGGGVVINEATAQLVAGYFDCESAGEVRTRGSAPTPVLRVLAERDVRSRIEAADPARLTPLVGRTREVELLRERWEQACEGVRNVILLVADPGIGKSRLVRVLRELVQSGAEQPVVVELFASPYHAASPFYPVIDAFDRQFELSREPDPVRKLDRLLTNLRAQGIRDDERLALFAAMLSIPVSDRLPPLALSPEKQKAKTLEALLAWLAARAERAPVLFVVEDLHWIDPSTEELLTEFVERGSESRILGLFTFRPEYDPPWKGKAVQTQVALNRLTRNQVVEMMRAQMGDAAIAPSVVDQIIERTDGVPLFVEEFTKLLAGSAGVATTIPATLQDLLLARLDRMASVRGVVQLGAVIGRTFSFDLLRAASELDESILRAELDKLVGAGLLFAKGSSPGTSFTFKHALIQDAAYQSLVKKQRQLFHKQVAEALEHAFPDIAATQPEVLAHHFTEAGESPKAISFWLLAGQRAREQSAHVEAIRHLTRGLEQLLKNPAGEVRDGGELPFRMMLAASCIAVHGYAADIVEEHIQAARALCERLGPTSPLFHVMMIIWAVRFIRGISDLAETTSGEIFAEASTRDSSYTVEAHWSGSSTVWWAGDFERSLKLSTRGMELYTVESSQQHAAILQQNCGPLMTIYKAWGFWMLGYPEQAHSVRNEALALADHLKDRFLIVATKWHCGFHTFLEGHFAEALACMNEVIAASEEGSYAFWIALGKGVQGAALVALDRPAEALPLLEDALARCDAIGSGILHTVFLAALADAHWALGQRPEARAALDRAQEHNDHLGQRAYEAELQRRRARYLLDESEADRAEAEARLLAALAVARKQKAKMFELRAAIDLARLRGDRTPVAELFATFTEGLDAPDLIAARDFLASSD